MGDKIEYKWAHDGITQDVRIDGSFAAVHKSKIGWISEGYYCDGEEKEIELKMVSSAKTEREAKRIAIELAKQVELMRKQIEWPK